MMVRFFRSRADKAQCDEIVRREVITLDDVDHRNVTVNDERVQREIRNLMKGQEPGRYRVQVRRRVVRP